MPDHKPALVKVIQGLVYFKLSLYLLGIIALFISMSADTSGLHAVRDGLLKRYELTQADSYSFGYIIGKMAVPIVITSILLGAIYKRNHTLAIVMASINIFLLFSSKTIPLLSIAILILLLVQPASTYLKGKKTTPKNESIIDDI